MCCKTSANALLKDALSHLQEPGMSAYRVPVQAGVCDAGQKRTDQKFLKLSNITWHLNCIVNGPIDDKVRQVLHCLPAEPIALLKSYFPIHNSL